MACEQFNIVVQYNTFSTFTSITVLTRKCPRITMVHTMCMKVRETNACENCTNMYICSLICIFCDSFSDLYLTRRVTSKKSV
jgi:hypothetical protein